MDDLISRQRLLKELKHHKELFCRNRIEFLGLSKNDKARVDEIDNCIATVINMRSVQPEIKTDGDTISRQAAIEAVYKNDHYTTIKQRLDALPSAQPEIIRCKDCKHKYVEDMTWHCPFGLMGGENFFCAYGALERMGREI